LEGSCPRSQNQIAIFWNFFNNLQPVV
jgi:hypothetical protein